MTISIIGLVLVTVLIVGVALFALPQSSNTNAPTAETSSANTTIDRPAFSETIEADTSSTVEQTESLFIPQPIPELDTGNECYLDIEVIAALESMEKDGQEDLVNAILDGEILLINHFASAGYTNEALWQIQRFYYAFFSELKDIPMADLISNLTACVAPEGADEYEFPSAVAQVFGWGENTDFTWVFEREYET